MRVDFNKKNLSKAVLIKAVNITFWYPVIYKSRAIKVETQIDC